MHVFVLSITLLIDDAYSLKDKRRVVKSIIQKSQVRFKVSVAEIAFHDVLNQSELAFAVVTNNSKLGRSHLEDLFRFVESTYPITVTDYNIMEI
ncbi:DUF503 domain-containing protein [Aerococcaceae bacterium DSM 111021]|nr:DUF503 domain-containing protein [Aerococcaceae bacterium DSM 111021]